MAFQFGSSTGSAGGFSFGSTPATSAAAGTTPAAGGFSFSTNSAAPAAPAGGGAGFAFGTPTASAGGGGLSFAQNKTPASGGLQLGNSTTPASGGLQLGSTAPAAGGFSFGASTGATATPSGGTVGGGLSFGGTATSTPASGFSLGGKASTTTAPTTGFSIGGSNTAGTTGFTLGGAKPTGLAAPTTAGASTGFGLAGGLKLGGALTQTTVAATTASTGFGVAAPLQIGVAKTTAATGLVLGAATTTTASTGLKLGTLGATTQATGLGTGFGAAATTTSTSFGAATATTKPVGFGVSSAVVTNPTSLSTATSTTASGTVAPSMNYRQLEEAINKWTIELEEQEKIFLQQATQVNAWDRLLIDNGEKITQLNTDVERVKIDQQRLDHELDFILAQQGELEALLGPLEKSIEQLPPINYQQHANPEREHTYQLAENIDAQLKRMVQDLKEIIDHLNTTNTNQDNNDPVHQIGKILNAHMDSLQWVDQNTSSLQRRVDEVTKLAELRRKEQERNFRLAYD